MKIVFSDFDGTLTVNGHLGADFFSIMDLVEQNESELIVVSGRSLSWGHFLLTHFPLKHVIMEGGGVIISKNHEGHLVEENLCYDEDIKELEDICERISKEFPKAVFSKDSFGRLTDRAVEFKDMKKEDVDILEKFFIDNKIPYSRSNVHINFWVGNLSKANAVKHFLKHYAPHVEQDEVIFYGDAKNDESMFEHFPNTVGVSNILTILDDLDFRPSIILEGKDNIGSHGVLAHLKEIFNQSADF